jgi:hypothetical protein
MQSRWFTGGIHVSHGIVISWVSGLGCNFGKPGIYLERLGCDDCARDCRDCDLKSKSYFAGFNVTGSRESNMAHVRIARNATAEERDKAFDINLKALYQLGKNPNGRELAPSVWRDEPLYP